MWLVLSDRSIDDQSIIQQPKNLDKLQKLAIRERKGEIQILLVIFLGQAMLAYK